MIVFSNSRSSIDPDDISEADPLDIAKILKVLHYIIGFDNIVLN